jgi:hypothetical protein
MKHWTTRSELAKATVTTTRVAEEASMEVDFSGSIDSRSYDTHLRNRHHSPHPHLCFVEQLHLAWHSILACQLKPSSVHSESSEGSAASRTQQQFSMDVMKLTSLP